MGWGGARSGAGKKPAKRANLLGIDGAKRERGPELPPAESQEDRAALREPPDDMTAGEQKAWRRWAPVAIERDTLTRGTVAGFRELCSRMAQVEALDRMTVSDLAGALELLRERRNWGRELNASLKDFHLTAFGKPETSGKPKAAVNPFAAKFG